MKRIWKIGDCSCQQVGKLRFYFGSGHLQVQGDNMQLDTENLQLGAEDIQLSKLSLQLDSVIIHLGHQSSQLHTANWHLIALSL